MNTDCPQKHGKYTNEQVHEIMILNDFTWMLCTIECIQQVKEKQNVMLASI